MNKLKNSIIAKMGQKNSYVPGLYIREARINLASGLLKDFDKTLNNALLSSISMFGDNSTSYATTLIDVADIYNAYGNYRLSAEFILIKQKNCLRKSNQLTDLLKGRIALVEAEAMTGQGFSNEAIALLRSMESYFAGEGGRKRNTRRGNSHKNDTGTLRRTCTPIQ